LSPNRHANPYISPRPFPDSLLVPDQVELDQNQISLSKWSILALLEFKNISGKMAPNGVIDIIDVSRIFADHFGRSVRQRG
jgi:hypothetical protein